MRVRVFFLTPSHTRHHPATHTIYYSAYAPAVVTHPLSSSSSSHFVIYYYYYYYIVLRVCVCIFLNFFFDFPHHSVNDTLAQLARNEYMTTFSHRWRLAFKQPHTPFGHNFRMQMPSAPTLNMVIIYYIILYAYRTHTIL